MKTLKFLFLATLGSLLVACSPQLSYQDNAETIFVDNPAPGVITVNSTGTGKTIGTAEVEAIEKAFRNILFQGVPSFTGLREPMVLDREAVEAKTPGLFASFFDNRSYEQFITGQSDPTITARYKRPRGYRVNKSLSINYHQLRKYLERIGATKKFGY